MKLLTCHSLDGAWYKRTMVAPQHFRDPDSRQASPDAFMEHERRAFEGATAALQVESYK